MESSVVRNVVPPNVAPKGMFGKVGGSASGLPTGKVGNAGIAVVISPVVVLIAMPLLLLLLLGTGVGYTIEEDVMVVMVEGIVLPLLVSSLLPMMTLLLLSPPPYNLDCSAVLGNLGLERSGTRRFLVIASKEDDETGAIGAAKPPPRRLISSSSSETWFT